MKKKSSTSVIIIIILFLVCAGLGYFTYRFYSEKQEQEAAVAALEAEKTMNSKTAYVALQDIRQGEEIIIDYNVELQQIYSGVEPYLFWSPYSDINIATTEISAGMPLMTSMVSDREVVDGLRDYECAVALLMTTQQDYDFVDIRIAFPDGSDFVVVSKKMVEDLSLENCLFTSEMKEEEILMMTSAILDAYMISGTQIYVTRYTDPALQGESAVTYSPKAATLALLGSGNPNLTNILDEATQQLNALARKSLEERIGQISEEDLDRAEEAWNDVTSKVEGKIKYDWEQSQDY